ncbi:MAG TPA: hypothetical protein VMC08_02085, partial [Bacteroidales bacterium]|nr:hypothetical protein [Bacteroidales bacterium]
MVSNSRRGVWLYLFILGFSSLFTQIYLLREFLVVYNGNELVIGIVLANWMLLTGLGAFLGRWYPAIKGRAGFLVFLQFIFAVLPLLMILKLDFWRAWVLPYGSMAGLVQIVWSSLLVQAPFCLINGFLFSALFSLLSETVKDDPGGRSYAVESLGSMAAGMIVNFVLLWFMEPYQSLRILLWLNLAGTILFSLGFLRKAALVVVIPLAVVLAILPLLADLGDMTGNLMFRDQERVYDRTTPYGRVTVTRDAGQLNFYENGLLL